MEKDDIRKLMVRNTGQDVNVLVAKWHHHDATSEAWVTPIVTVLPETARISGSRVLMRGAAFTAENIKAKKVWTDADGDLTISFAIRGEDLAFDNQAAPNVSSWLEVDRLPSFTAMKADQALSSALREQEDGLKDGLCGRVVINHQSVTRATAVLQVTDT